MKIICNDRLVLFYLFLIICFFSQRGGQVQGVKRVRQGNLLCAHDPQGGKKDQGISLIIVMENLLNHEEMALWVFL
jgi:hypothetical protein